MIFSSGVGVAFADGTPQPPQPAETPGPPPPAGEGGSTSVFIKSISTIIHRLVFPAETISEALGNIFMKAAEANENAAQQEFSTWTSVLVQVVQAPSRGSYSDVARSSLPVAGSLAVALFILRLTMYHWNKLLGESDSPLQVLGDWLTAGVLAVVCGPFLDMIVRLGWWTMAAVLGETSSLAKQFLGVMIVQSFVPAIQLSGTVVFLQGIVAIALGLGALLALAAMIFAFGVAQSTLYVLAVLGPSFAVASVIPEMRWLRSLWIKGVVLVAIMPIMAGGIFKAGILASTYLSVRGGVGLMSGMIRILWMFGAAGLLLTATGILGRITLGSAAETIGKMWDVAKGIAGTVALVGGVMATGGAVGAGTGIGMAAGAESTVAGGSVGQLGQTAAGGGLGSALGSLDKASTMNTMSNIFSSMGLSNHARIAGGLAHGHELNARRQDLAARIGNFNQRQAESVPVDVGIEGISSKAAQSMLDSFGGSADEFKQVFPAIQNSLERAGFPTAGVVANQYSAELGSMAKLYQSNPDYYNSTPDMLLSLAQDAGATKLHGALSGRPY
ncbi:MAG TPA: hypothetical protein VHP14_15635 [Anaerolineales bacterium]|nr:hypothetical protein [Anaerolineales bacterium]